MSMHEKMKPGIYIDEVTGDIWRKSNPEAAWTVNGQEWKLFPKVLTTLHTVISAPAVSIADAAQPREEWRIIPTFPRYEINFLGEVRDRESQLKKTPVNINSNDSGKVSYWLLDEYGYGHWVAKETIDFEAVPWNNH